MRNPTFSSLFCPLLPICPPPLLLPLSSCPVRLIVFRASLSARQDCNINVRKRSFLWCKAAMTTSAMFHSDLSISVNKCIATLPQTVTHSSRETLTHCFLLSPPRWRPSNGNAADVNAHTNTTTHILYIICVCVCY